MKRLIYLLSVAMLALSSCNLARVDADEEGVFVKKPWFFGRGGVSDDVLTQGTSWKVLSTDFITYKNVPVKYEEKFDDVMSDDNTPVDLQAYVILRVNKGKSGALHQNYGQSWYENNIRETFRKSIRDRVSTWPMYDLTSNREVCERIENEVSALMNEYFGRLNADKEFPVSIMNIVMDRARPNQEVMEEINKTASQIQAKQTQIKQREMEAEREKTEKQRAKADKAYQQEMALTAEQFIMLRGLEMEMQKVEMVRGKQNVNVDVMFGNSNLIWDIKQK
jgi:hypothetical protein